MSKAKVWGYTVAAAARELDVSYQQVYRWLRDGTLELLPVNGHARLATTASVLDLKRDRAVEVG
jgi:transposase-like protein